MSDELSEVAAADAPFSQDPILCVDQSRDCLDHLSSGLRLAGYTTTTATDGGTAIALSSQTRFALAIVSCDLSDGDGVELLRRLRERNGVPAIFLAAEPLAPQVNQATHAGATCVLVKPIEKQQLMSAVQTTLLRQLEMEQMRQKLQRLELARHKRHETGIVVGLLMERLRISSKEALDGLRRIARARHRKISDVAADILRNSEDLLTLTRQIGDACCTAKYKGARR